MMNTVTQLVELQELEITLTESAILHKNNSHDGVESLRQEVTELRECIPRDMLARYDKLRTRGLAVAKEEKGTCNGCRLNIPKGDLNRMRNGTIDWVCPNCGRFLLLSKI